MLISSAVSPDESTVEDYFTQRTQNWNNGIVGNTAPCLRRERDRQAHTPGNARLRTRTGGQDCGEPSNHSYFIIHTFSKRGLGCPQRKLRPTPYALLPHKPHPQRISESPNFLFSGLTLTPPHRVDPVATPSLTSPTHNGSGPNFLFSACHQFPLDSHGALSIRYSVATLMPRISAVFSLSCCAASSTRAM